MYNPKSSIRWCLTVFAFHSNWFQLNVFIYFFVRTHANGSIKRGSKDNATDAVQLRTGIGVQLKDIKVFNKARQQGRETPPNRKP